MISAIDFCNATTNGDKNYGFFTDWAMAFSDFN